ncbi:Conidiation protein 6-domain-containing protein [Cristinia sonorae]|uniref:Conidiation protein 6-domain-containing protein n=1 Tax=Cristinia sonorae TaxID=1940300 RepID=A0A8K0UYD1_9AGAR|nr:Conidiation protein 6-domain-containing protein [Cristinia sonorae]
MSSLPTQQIGGHKAAINNPNVSEEAKERSRQAIEELEADGGADAIREGRNSSKNEGNVIGGYKATLKNPNVSEEAKEKAQKILEEKDAI